MPQATETEVPQYLPISEPDRVAANDIYVALCVKYSDTFAEIIDRLDLRSGDKFAQIAKDCAFSSSRVYRRTMELAANKPAGLFDKVIDLSPSDKLQHECIGVRVNFSWYRTSKQVDKAAKTAMANATEATEDGFSATKRLMDSKHPAIKAANELQRRISGYFAAMSVPLAAFASGGKPEPGVRLIPISKIDEFDKRMNAFRPEVESAMRRLNAALPDIKAMDATRLRGLYNAADYPDDLVLDISWGYVQIDVPSALERLAPEIYERELSKLQNRMEDTYRLATQGIINQLLSVVQTWIDVLGPVTRIYPSTPGEYAAYYEGEVREQLTHEDDTAIPEGKIKVRVRYYPAGSDTVDETLLGPMTPEEYKNQLKPSQAINERRVFKNTTISAMTDFLASFRNVKSVVSTTPELESAITAIERHITQLPTGDAVARELRDSSTFRTRTHALMQELNKKVVEQVEIFKQRRRVVARGLLMPDTQI